MTHEDFIPLQIIAPLNFQLFNYLVFYHNHLPFFGLLILPLFLPFFELPDKGASMRMIIPITIAKPIKPKIIITKSSFLFYGIISILNLFDSSDILPSLSRVLIPLFDE